MIDTIGSITGTIIYTVVIGVLVGMSPASRQTKLVGFIAAASWYGIVVAVATLGGFAPGAAGPIPAPVFALALLLALLFGGWFLKPEFRRALLSLPLPALIGVNVFRLGGVFFLILWADGRLSAPFGSIAGLGDMLVAGLAIPLAIATARSAHTPQTRLAWWNALGALDLVIAISLGALSAPAMPIRVLTGGPGTLAMTALPWVMVPAMLVPLYLMIHFTIAVRLRSGEPVTYAAAMATRRNHTRTDLEEQRL